MEMTNSEICSRYERNKTNRQIQILAELNDVEPHEIKKILTEAGKELPPKTIKKKIEMAPSVSFVLFARIDELDEEIKELAKAKAEKEKEYLEIVNFMKEFGKEKE